MKDHPAGAAEMLDGCIVRQFAKPYVVLGKVLEELATLLPEDRAWVLTNVDRILRGEKPQQGESNA